jgi:putative membrane protein
MGLEGFSMPEASRECAQRAGFARVGDNAEVPEQPCAYTRLVGASILLTVLRGFLMGSADVVPGVSGGTVALVLGFYQRLVASVKAGSSALGRFARLQIPEGIAWLRRVEWLFLVPLLAGIALAIATLASLIETQLNDHPVEVAALFLGLVASSVIVAWRHLRRRDPARLAVMVAVAAALFVALGLRGGTSEDSVAQATDPAVWAYFLAGAVAICAMILPGISGSLILVLLGMYGPVLDAVTDHRFGLLGVFLVGATLGLALFSQLLHWALAHHHDTVMAALIGLMLGSTRVLWPWPNGLNSTQLGAIDGSVPAALTLAIIGLVAVLAVNELAMRREDAIEAAEVSEAPAS